MDAADSSVLEKIKDITECCVCLKTFTEPRMLPCIHTFCLACLEEIGSKSGKKPGEAIPCAICRKEFTIPDEGFGKIQKNFFMEKLIEVGKISKPEEKNVILCDVCKNMSDVETAMDTSLANTYCVDCQENLCKDCERRHRAMRATRDHCIVVIGSKIKEEALKTSFKPLTCDQHPFKILDYYCADCKKVVCVSCFVESHKLHMCSDVSKVSEEFRKTIELDLEKISTCLAQSFAQKEQLKRQREEYTQDFSAKRKAIIARSHELKETVDRDAKSLIEELTDMEVKRMKEMETVSETMETDITIMESLKAFGSALASKGSPADICHSVDKIHEGSIEMEMCIKSKAKQVPLVNRATFRVSKLHKTNCVGTVAEFEKTFIIVGFDLGETITKDVAKISLQRENEVCRLDPLPTSMAMEATATVIPEKEVLFVIGVGRHSDEIWKYHSIFKWSKCGCLVQKRRRHCTNFVENVLYVSGGSLLDFRDTILDSVEAFDTETDECAVVGKLVHAIESASSIARGSSVYVFGGYGEDDRPVDYVQVYDTIWNQCTILSSRMPCCCAFMRAVLWENSVILLGRRTCFLFNFETGAWQERKRFKTNAIHFGFIIDDEKIFVVGGGNSDALEQWTCRDDVRYIPLVNFIEDEPVEWKMHAKLPKRSLVHAFGGIMLEVA